jgi:SAM-dependent methyltransferase
VEVLGLSMTPGTVPGALSNFPSGAYALVSLFHVLEHLTDPVGALQALARLLSPQGRLLVEVPDASWFSSPDNMFFRAHTLYFTAHSLQATVRAAGLEVVASQFGQTGNLRVLLRPQPQPPNAQTGSSWVASDALMKGQRARSWPRYLWRRLTEGYLWRRWQARREEAATAARYASPQALLDAVASGALRPHRPEI